MLKLTLHNNGATVYLNPAHIVAMQQGQGETLIKMVTGAYSVRQHTDQIMRLINDNS